jgi:hypothetical protein
MLEFSRHDKPTDSVSVGTPGGRFWAECLNAHWLIKMLSEYASPLSWEWSDKRGRSRACEQKVTESYNDPLSVHCYLADNSGRKAMIFGQSAVSLDEEGEHFVLGVPDGDGATTEIKLTADQVLSLSRSALSLEERILARHNPQGEGAVPLHAVFVEEFLVQADRHGDYLIQTVALSQGRRMVFAFARQYAIRLAVEVQSKVAEMQRLKPAG